MRVKEFARRFLLVMHIARANAADLRERDARDDEAERERNQQANFQLFARIHTFYFRSKFSAAQAPKSQFQALVCGVI